MLWLLLILLGAALIAWLGRRWLPERPEAAGAAPLAADELPAAPIGDELDLHGVPPIEVGDLVDAFIDEAHRRGTRHVCIVHGTGIVALRATVRARLARHPAVRAFGDAPPPQGWGATLVELQISGTAVDPATASD